MYDLQRNRPAILILEGFIYTENVTSQIEAGYTIVMLLLNRHITQSKQRKASLPVSTPLGVHYRFRVNSKFTKRVSDLFVASLSMPNLTVVHSIGAQFALNYHERVPLHVEEG